MPFHFVPALCRSVHQSRQWYHLGSPVPHGEGGAERPLGAAGHQQTPSRLRSQERRRLRSVRSEHGGGLDEGDRIGPRTENTV